MKAKVDTGLDFKKAWSLVKKLGTAKPPTIHLNLIGAHILNISNSTFDEGFTDKMDRELKSLRA